VQSMGHGRDYGTIEERNGLLWRVIWEVSRKSEVICEGCEGPGTFVGRLLLTDLPNRFQGKHPEDFFNFIL